MSTSDDSWRPTATRGVLEQRARALACIREFFAQRAVLEVDTPIIVNAPVTDVHIHSAQVRFPDSPGRFYLHTSPEFAMKRLLASGSGDIFQICHVARGLERGRHHNAEFTLIEWYRQGFSLDRLMDEVDALARAVLEACRAAAAPARQRTTVPMAQPDKLPGPLTPPLRRERISYVEAFKTAFGIDPLVVPLEELRALARSAGLVTRPSQDSPPSMSPQHSTGSPGSPVNSPGALADSASAPINTPADALAERDELLEFLMGVKIGPTLGRNALTFIHRYPASQAALARLDPHDPRVALRFELYCEGIELANGFHELASPGEQRARFEHDLAERRRRGLAADRMDELLLRALEAGLPECAGVAVGFDRLLMLATGASHIDEVLPFPIERA